MNWIWYHWLSLRRIKSLTGTWNIIKYLAQFYRASQFLELFFHFIFTTNNKIDRAGIIYILYIRKWRLRNVVSFPRPHNTHLMLSLPSQCTVAQCEFVVTNMLLPPGFFLGNIQKLAVSDFSLVFILKNYKSYILLVKGYQRTKKHTEDKTKAPFSHLQRKPHSLTHVCNRMPWSQAMGVLHFSQPFYEFTYRHMRWVF